MSRLLERYDHDQDAGDSLFFDPPWPTSDFHFRTSSLARSATSFESLLRSLLTVTPILVSCPSGLPRQLLPTRVCSSGTHSKELVGRHDFGLELLQDFERFLSTVPHACQLRLLRWYWAAEPC